MISRSTYKGHSLVRVPAIVWRGMWRQEAWWHAIIANRSRRMASWTEWTIVSTKICPSQMWRPRQAKLWHRPLRMASIRTNFMLNITFLNDCLTLDMNTNGDMLLEKILEEDSIYGDERIRDNMSPISNDKKYLLGNGHTNGTHITRI